MVSNNGLTVTKTKCSYWATAVSRIGLGMGTHYWEVRIDSIDHHKAIMIGVTNDKASRLTGFYQQVSGEEIGFISRHTDVFLPAWAYYSFTGEKYHSYKPIRYAEPFEKNDVIGVLLEVQHNTASLSFFRNNEFKGAAFKDLTGTISER